MVGTKDPVTILEKLRPMYGEGVYPGRSGDMDRPGWMNGPFHVLLATILSQRTRDENTRAAADNLFSRYPTASDIHRADVSEVERLIRKAGFPVQKAKAIKEISRIMVEEKGGELPSDMDFLLSLPMVGRKTANCVRAYAFDIPAICVDTHVHRISNLIGLVNSKVPEETEEQLLALVPEQYWKEINALLVRHGQVICLPRRPKCQDCPIIEHCDHGLSSDR